MKDDPASRDALSPRIRRAFHLGLRRRANTEADVDEELRLHLALRVEQLIAEGWTRADAEREAQRRFGPSWSDAVHNLHHSGTTRQRKLAMRERLDAFRHDIRYVLRTLVRAPRFVAAAVLTLSLGIGASTVIFSLVDHIVLRPLPYAAPEQLVVVRRVGASLKAVYPTLPANASRFLEWKRGCTVCTDIAAIKRAALTLSGDGDPQRLGAARVSSNLFSMLGVRPALGRDFLEEEDRIGGEPVVILSDALWRRQFGADSSVVGRSIMLNERAVRVVGVLPRDAGIPGGSALGVLVALPTTIDVYRPLALTEREARSPGEYDYAVIARLRPGVTVAQAQAQFEAVGRPPESGPEAQTAVVPLQRQIVGAAQRPLLLLLAAVGTVLLIVCVNLVNLTFVRSAGRARESAIRAALGAGSGRIARLALIECMVLAIAGGLAGLVFAHWGLDGLVALAPKTLPRIAEVQLDTRVFLAALCVTACVGLVVGALPAWRAGRALPAEALKAGRTTTDGRAAARRRSLFIAAQVAFSTILLMGTGLFIASFVRVLQVDPGVDISHVAAVNVTLPESRYATAADQLAFYDRAVAELAAVPGITAAATTSALPLEGETWVDGVARADNAGANDDWMSANFRFVSPDYFATVGTRLERGRSFGSIDRGQQMVIISARTASTLWPNDDAIGKRVLAGGRDALVIGIAADIRTSTLEQEGSLVVYLPTWEFPMSGSVIIARTVGVANADAITAIRAAIRRVDPAVAVSKMRTMEQVIADVVASRRFQVALLGLFAVLALATASIGIYGVLAGSLASRTNEIGVRMALGALPRDVHRLVLREGLAPVLAGLLIGIGGAFAIGRVIANLLYGVTPGDPVTIAIVVLVLGTVGVVACVIPARRSTRVALDTMLRMQ